MIVKTADQVKTVFKTIARAYGFERVELSREGHVFNDCLLKFFRSKEWIDSYMASCEDEGADLPDRKYVETSGCTLVMDGYRYSSGRILATCKDTAEDDAIWLMLWDYFLHAAKSYNICLMDGVTSEVLVAKAGSTEERILVELDLAGFKVELDT